MEEVMEMIRKYEKKIGSEHVNIKFFSDGSGEVRDSVRYLFMFESLEELQSLLKE